MAIGYQIGKATVRSGELEPLSHPSDCVASLSYDFDREQVTCHFHKRGSYTYFNVEPQTFAEWNNAGSRGTYFNLYIRDRYEFERISY
jgi:hypothetical protein